MIDANYQLMRLLIDRLLMQAEDNYSNFSRRIDILEHSNLSLKQQLRVATDNTVIDSVTNRKPENSTISQSTISTERIKEQKRGNVLSDEFRAQEQDYCVSASGKVHSGHGRCTSGYPKSKSNSEVIDLTDVILIDKQMPKLCSTSNRASVNPSSSSSSSSSSTLVLNSKVNKDSAVDVENIIKVQSGRMEIDRSPEEHKVMKTLPNNAGIAKKRMVGQMLMAWDSSSEEESEYAGKVVCSNLGHMRNKIQRLLHSHRAAYDKSAIKATNVNDSVYPRENNVLDVISPSLMPIREKSPNRNASNCLPSKVTSSGILPSIDRNLVEERENIDQSMLQNSGDRRYSLESTQMPDGLSPSSEQSSQRTEILSDQILNKRPVESTLSHTEGRLHISGTAGVSSHVVSSTIIARTIQPQERRSAVVHSSQSDSEVDNGIPIARANFDTPESFWDLTIRTPAAWKKQNLKKESQDS